jgi:RNA polymerase sigma-70 factor, ECF subfamily
VDAPPELVAFVEREHPRLVRAVDLLLDDRAVAEEVAQETLLRVASRWEHVSGLSSPGGWAHRVAVNLATSQLRRRRVAWRARSRVATPSSQPEADTATSLAVRAGLARLNEAQRRLLVLRHVLGWSAREIGDMDGVRPDTVRQQLHRARQALRAELGTAFDIEIDERLDDEETQHVHEAR